MDLSKIPDILKKIVADKEIEIQELPKKVNEFKHIIADLPETIDFKSAIKQSHLTIISEIKKASPSAGIIAHDFSPTDVAMAYSETTNAVSVLTDYPYFKGRAEYIPEVRPILNGIPILRKDFIIGEAQIYESRALGADTFLLISAILEKTRLKDYIELGRSLGMEPLVESHDEWELENALEAGAVICGVNNRDLRTFTVDLKTSERIVNEIPDECIKVSESGIHSIEDVKRMRVAGYDAVLVGEALMRAGLSHCSEEIEKFKVV
jgi:indole-3-glycerol phosphate synthase